MIVMGLGGQHRVLDAARDTLVNVNAHGQPVPTARFMAGREYDELTGGKPAPFDENDESAVLTQGIMALPSLHLGTGPFPNQSFAWTPAEPANPAQRAAAASFYLALMGSACLDLIGAMGETVVEGPLAGNRAFLRMLATSTGCPVLAAGAGAGTGLGAAVLAGPLQTARETLQPILPEPDPLWARYVSAWQRLTESR